jgi:hypothetical protein
LAFTMANLDLQESLRACRAQHAKIREMLAKFPASEPLDEEAVVAQIHRLAAVLGAHLQVEDDRLYPILMANANGVLSKKARRYSTHMGSIAEVFADWRARWTQPGAIRLGASIFLDQWRELQTALVMRMDSEDEDLYAIAELIASTEESQRTR